MKTHTHKMHTLSIMGLVLVGLLASACGETELSPITQADGSFLEGSTPNAIVIKAAQLPSETGLEVSGAFNFSDLDEEALVVLFSNRPLSCVAPEQTIGCDSQAGWLFAVPLHADTDLQDPLTLQNTARREVQVHHEGATGCSVGGSAADEGAATELLTMSVSAGAVSAQLAGIADFQSWSIDGSGTKTDLTYSVNGSYEVTLCSGVPAL